MRVARERSADQWRAQYFAACDGSQLVLDHDVNVLLAEFSDLLGQPKSWLTARMLFAHAHGRLRQEQMSPGHVAAADRLPAGISVALLEDLANLAQSVGKANDAYLRDVLLTELCGELGADAVDVLDDEAWRNDDVSLKVWLPASLDAAVKDLAECWEVTASDVLRNLLLVHLFGRLGYQRALQRRTWTGCRRQPEAEAPMYSKSQAPPGEELAVAPRTQFVRLHGKSGSGVRFWLPTAMKAALSALAVVRGRSLSEYARLVILEIALGKSYTA